MKGVKVERIYRLNDNDGALKGFADISIADNFIVKGLRIVQGKDGLYVGMPKEQGKDGKWYNRVTLLNEPIRDALSALVLTAFES